jgi:hypothetical protein
MKFVLIFSFLVVSSILLAQKGYFPIETDKEWNYAYSEEMQTLMGEVEINCRISAIKTRLNKNEYFVMIFSYSDEAFGQPYEVYYRYIDGKGWYSYNVDSEKDELEFPEKAEVGTKCSNDSFTMEVTSLDERIKTPGMNYPSCVVVKSTEKGAKNAIPTYTYYVEGIGSVGIVTNEKVINYLKN